MTVEFFGDVDKNSRGEVSSVMPAWFFDVKLDDLRETVARKKRQIENGQILPESVLLVRQEVVDIEGKIEDIEKSKPILNTTDKDKMSKVYHALQNKIATSMPTHRDEKMGYADPREELKRMKDKHISIDPAVAKSCGMKPVKGKISGDEANKIYRMIGRVLGENENVEKIRREGRSESQRSMDEMTKFIMEEKINGAKG